MFIVRALQAQIEQFLSAARRLAKGDFSQPVPIHGKDEFAALGVEFNNMSQELANKIEEVESKRRELEETIRRVGEAFAAGLDRQGLLDLAVRQAVEACEADAGRAVPIDPRKMHRAYIGDADKSAGGRARGRREGRLRDRRRRGRRAARQPRPGARGAARGAAPAHGGVRGRGAGAGRAAARAGSTAAPT